MGIFLAVSVAANALLCLALVTVVRNFRAGNRFATEQMSREREKAALFDAGVRRVGSMYWSLAEAVSVSLASIREDIDRNYHHTHDGHVLDRLASDLKREIRESRAVVYEIGVSEESADQVRALGGNLSGPRSMTLGQLLEFGWRLHTLSRERSDQLTNVVRQPCGNRDHAGWMGKVLAIYELMCDRDKDLATRRFGAVIEAWRHEPTQFAPRYVEDVR